MPPHHGGPGLFRSALCVHQPAHPLARHGAHPAPAAAHRDRAGHHGHRPRAGAHGRQDGPGPERSGHAPGNGHEHFHGFPGRDRGRLPAGTRHAAPGAHPVRYRRGAGDGGDHGRDQLGGGGQSPWLALPAFSLPEFSWEPLLFIIPVTLAPVIEHFGDIIAISSVTGKDYLRDPGVKNTMLGDGIATMAACLLGGPPNTTYSEVTGAVTLTRAFNPAVMTWAALCAILLSMVAKVGAFLSCIPAPVMGGITILCSGPSWWWV